MAYVALADANTYFSTKMHTEPWDDSSDAKKTKALAHATVIIDRLNYAGSKTEDAQANEFPRNDNTVIPQDILDASCEIAKALLDGVDPEAEFTDIGISNQGYSSVRSSYDTNMARDYIVAGVPSATAWRLLLPYFRDANSFILSRVS